MKLLSATVLCAILACSLAAPSFASDMIRRPDVPSSRNQAKTGTTKKKSSSGSLSGKLSTKIVKNTKTGNSGGDSSRPKGSLQ